MTFEEFLKKLNEAGSFSHWQKFDENSELEIGWSLGGRSGGSCWDEGDAVYHSYPGEAEPEFESFDKALEIVCPNIGFLQYKRIKQEVVNYSDSDESDYYGNSSSTAKKSVSLKELYKELVKREII